jgi:hypothetical protein
MDLDRPEDSLSDPCPEQESDWTLSACGDSPPTSFYSLTDCECPSEAGDSQNLRKHFYNNTRSTKIQQQDPQQ